MEHGNGAIDNTCFDNVTSVNGSLYLVFQSEHGHHSHEGHALSPRVYAAHAQRDVHAADVPQPSLRDLHQERPISMYTYTLLLLEIGVRKFVLLKILKFPYTIAGLDIIITIPIEIFGEVQVTTNKKYNEYVNLSYNKRRQRTSYLFQTSC